MEYITVKSPTLLDTVYLKWFTCHSTMSMCKALGIGNSCWNTLRIMHDIISIQKLTHICQIVVCVLLSKYIYYTYGLYGVDSAILFSVTAVLKHTDVEIDEYRAYEL